jgi:ElaB/YqjD/DUF883 family membrane-anchored ribosome-binding protein
MTGSFDTLSSGNDRSIGSSDRKKGENETEVLAADIRITQERLGNTVEEIGERFNPTRLKAELKNDIRDATIGRVEDMAQQSAEFVSDAQRTVMQSVRENPIPAAMIGLGLGWLVLNARSSKKKMSSGSLYEEPQRTEFGTSYEEQQYGYDDRQSGAQQSGTLGPARAKAGGVVDSMKQKSSKLADQTRMQTRRVERAFQENPLVIGAAALALGLAAGLAIPATEKEMELVGDSGDHLVDKMRDVAEDTKGKVQHVAERVVNEAQSTAKDAAQEVGLMSS